MADAKQNVPGFEYEVYVSAYFALLLNINPEIKDFKLRSNVPGFGNFDDLLIDTKTECGKNLYFAFELKHNEKSSNLLPTTFEATIEFNSEKYCEEFKKLNEENRKKYLFILYTNKDFDFSRTSEVQKFDMKEDESCLGRSFFDTSGHSKHVYEFEVNEETEDGKNLSKEDFREFFSQFCLYTRQADFTNLGNFHILKILKYKDCYVRYIDFFRKWHRGDFADKSLDKKTLNVHLVDMFLSSFAINNYLSNDQDRNSNFFEEQFDVITINSSKQDFIGQLEENVYKYPKEFNNISEEEIIQLAKDSKFIDKFAKELTKETKLKLLHYFFQKPLILHFNTDSKNQIYEACKLCRLQETRIKLVIMGKDIDVSKFSHLKIFTNTSYTFLHFAVLHDNTELIMFLLGKRVDVNIQDKDGWSPLHWAVKRNNLEITELLVEKGANINIQDGYNCSPLHYAVERNNLEISKLLVEKGADVNVKNLKGETPLFRAVEQNNFEISKLLVEKGADVNMKKKCGLSSPLILAIERNSLEISKLLVENGADVNIQDKDGWSPLRWAVERKNFEISTLLVEKGADVNIKYLYGESPLYRAVEQNTLEIAKLLVEKGADVNITDKYGFSSPLLLAVKQNNFEISTLLVEKGANVNIKYSCENSPLFWAVEQNNFEIAKLLVEKGAYINIKDKHGKSPLFYAVKQNNPQISKLLFKSGAKVNSEIRDTFYSLLSEK